MTETRHKYGDVREDGMVFRQYGKSYRNGERWVTPEKFEEMRLRSNEEMKKRYSDDESFRLRRKEYGDSYRNDPLNKLRKKEYEEAYRKDPLNKARKNAYRRDRLASDPMYAMTCRLRGRIANALNLKGFPKSGKTEKLVGCSYKDFMAHIESLFTEGMSWENYNQWHLDHITPLASASNKEELEKLFHYTNQQPLWAGDNMSKGAKILN